MKKYLLAVAFLLALTSFSFAAQDHHTVAHKSASHHHHHHGHHHGHHGSAHH